MTTSNLWSELNLEPIIQKVMADEFKFQYNDIIIIRFILDACLQFHTSQKIMIWLLKLKQENQTLTFLVPLINLFSKQKYLDHYLFVLVLSPTRELAQQIYDVAKKFQIVNQTKIAFAMGGTSNQNDVKYLNEKGCNVLISTPGKLRQLLDMSDLQIDVKTLEYLIFDVADTFQITKIKKN